MHCADTINRFPILPLSTSSPKIYTQSCNSLWFNSVFSWRLCHSQYLWCNFYFQPFLKFPTFNFTPHILVIFLINVRDSSFADFVSFLCNIQLLAHLLRTEISRRYDHNKAERLKLKATVPRRLQMSIGNLLPSWNVVNAGRIITVQKALQSINIFLYRNSVWW